MKAKFNLKLQFASAGLALALVSSGCAMMAPKGESYVAPPLGATWVNARRDTGSFGSKSVTLMTRRGEQMWEGQQMVALETPEGTTLAYPSSGAWVGIFKGSTPMVTFDPPLGLAWPLEVGKTQKTTFHVTNHASKKIMSFDLAQKVEAYEDVTVPAGTFKAFKISFSDTLGNETMHWYSPDLNIFVKSSYTRTAKYSAGAGTRETELVSQNIRK